MRLFSFVLVATLFSGQALATKENQDIEYRDCPPEITEFKGLRITKTLVEKTTESVGQIIEKTGATTKILKDALRYSFETIPPNPIITRTPINVLNFSWTHQNSSKCEYVEGVGGIAETWTLNLNSVDWRTTYKLRFDVYEGLPFIPAPPIYPSRVLEKNNKISVTKMLETGIDKAPYGQSIVPCPLSNFG